MSERLFAGRHLELRREGRWEYATRITASGVVGIVALTEARELVLVEQFRAPVASRVIELPAGIAGDLADAADETLLDAACRELFEETGFVASRWTLVADGTSSAGLTDEIVHLFVARGLTRRGAGGGDASEDITVHQVPLAEVPAWLADRRGQGVLIDHKVYAALFLAGEVWDGTVWRPDGA